MNGLSRAVLFAEICFEVDSRNVLRSSESTVLPAVLPYSRHKIFDSPTSNDCPRRPSRSLFRDIYYPSSSLCHLLPPVRDTSVLSGLRTATRFTRPIARTKNIVPLLITL